MSHMAALRAPIDAFFEAVQVNAENQIVRRNRLNLLHQIVETCGQVADLASCRADPDHRGAIVTFQPAPFRPVRRTGQVAHRVVSYAATAKARAFRTA
jgi:hypothetical protein